MSEIDPPPPYEASSSSSTAQPASSSSTANPTLTVNGVPAHARRSMEDETRPLPPGWIRQFDAKSKHQYFVDTTSDPPRTIWHHPYDDETYMSSLSPSERAKIHNTLHSDPTHDDIIAAHSDDEREKTPDPDAKSKTKSKADPDAKAKSKADKPESRDRPATLSTPQPKGARSFGRRLKDSLTNTTHEERARLRAQRAREEQEAYERHQQFRQAMAKAAETGVPQLIGKDSQGRDVYIEGPYGPGAGPAGVGTGPGYVGYNPYTQGPYANPNARFVRPEAPYQGRPYYGGYGGGLGLPIALGLGGGLLAGSLLGDFGGYGGGYGGDYGGGFGGDGGFGGGDFGGGGF